MMRLRIFAALLLISSLDGVLCDRPPFTILVRHQPTTSPTPALSTLAPTPQTTRKPYTILVRKSPTASPISSNAPSNSPSQEGTISVANILDADAQITTFGCAPASEESPFSNAFDVTTNKTVCIKNGGADADVGMVVAPSHGQFSIVEGIRVYADDSCSGCDPVTYKIEGRKNEVDDWTIVSEGIFPWIDDDAAARNPEDTAISSTYESGDGALSFSEVSIANTENYKDYRLTFTTRAPIAAQIPLTIGEVELVGKVIEGSAPTKPPTNAPTKEPTKMPTDDSSSPSSSPTYWPTYLPTSPPTYVPTNGGTISVANILDTATEISTFGCAPETEDYPWQNAFDGTTKMFACARSGLPDDDIGMIVTPSHGQSSIIEGIRVYANEICVTCDPVAYKIEGRIDTSSDWTIVSNGTFPWIDDDAVVRNPEDAVISSTYESGDDALSFSEATIANFMAYKDYRLTFTTRAPAPLMFGEVELVGKVQEGVTNNPTESPTASPVGIPEKVLFVTTTPVVVDFEDPESLDIFESEGWAITDGGHNSAKAVKAPSDLTANQKADLSLVIDTKNGGHLTWRLKSEVAAGDLIMAYLNETLGFQLGSPTSIFLPVRLALPAGHATATWRYTSTVDALGTALIDDIKITPYIVDDFSSGDFSYLPWDADDGWDVDDSNTNIGGYSAHFSGNVEVGGFRALSVEVSSVTGGAVSVQIHADVGMPYDQALIYIDEEVVQGYPAKTGGFVIFNYDLDAGTHTIGFRVWRPNFDPQNPRNETVNGSGQAWIDEFQFYPNSPV